MKNLLICLLSFTIAVAQAQTGHVLQGAGAVNFSMGGAGTAMPADILGALQWNPASITAFDKSEVALSVAYFTASPEVYAKVVDPQSGLTLEGTTEDELGASPLPTLGAVFAKEDSPFAFGVSAFGISGFGVDFPAETNLPDPSNTNFDPSNSNPLLYPQDFGGFGHLNSEYQLLQVALTGAYEITDGLSFGLAPTINYASLTIQPVPIASPSPDFGYPVGEKANAIGFGFQAGLFYQTEMGLNLGISYKSTQWFEDLEIEGEYLNGQTAPTTNFNLDYPSIISVGLGYTADMFDFALDYRLIDYENTDGFAETGWTPTASVAGFGWDNVHVIALGVQLKMVENVPIRLGYTFNTNPINEDNVFFSSAAPAVLENAVQVGLGYNVNEKLSINAAYHRGFSPDVTGQLLNPMLITPENPLGKVPGSEITSNMHTAVILLGVSYGFGQ